MHKGNANSAIKLLTNKMENRILPLNDNTMKLLQQKHVEPDERPDGWPPIDLWKAIVNAIKNLAPKSFHIEI